jgi:hypothetical protein
LGISEANVKVRLLRARLQLREKLTRYFGDETKRVMPHRDEEPIEWMGGGYEMRGTAQDLERLH